MLEGNIILLRGLELDDVETLHKLVNVLKYKIFMLRQDYISLEEEKEWIRQIWKNQKVGRYVFGITLKKNGELIGTISLEPKKNYRKTARVGIAIMNDNYWSKGYGTEALRLLVFYAFQIKNFERLELTVASFNQRAIRCYKKVGFRQVGTWRKALEILNEIHDVIIMELLKGDEIYGEKIEAMAREYKNEIQKAN